MLRSTLTLGSPFLSVALLVLWGWGLDNLAAFFENPVRSAMAAMALATVLAAAVLKLDFHPLRKGAESVTDQTIQLAVLLVLSLALLWFLPFADRNRILTLQHGYWRCLGLLLFTVGVTVRIAGLKTLGRNFSAYVTLQPDHRLVQHGIYARIRHPLYLSLLLTPTGIALVFASILALPILALAAAFIFDRIRQEEHLLAARFGAEYEDYQRRTGKLLPRVL
ncbi:MAG: isoprenylcysteine carboxylmethyltransferase family protein [Terriglobales bacterium]|jgi:protein-S-isoprenylcysteine O-methyltransferase Ste14